MFGATSGSEEASTLEASKTPNRYFAFPLSKAVFFKMVSSVGCWFQSDSNFYFPIEKMDDVLNECGNASKGELWRPPQNLEVDLPILHEDGVIIVGVSFDYIPCVCVPLFVNYLCKAFINYFFITS